MKVLAALLGAALAPPQAELDENAYYTVERYTTPEGERLEVGGLDFLPDGRLAVSTRRGQVWLVEDALAEDPGDARFELFAEGLQEGLGLAVVGGEVHVLQRGELSRLRDADGDGRADHVDTLANDWGLSGNYHEFAFGLPRDAAGNFYVGLNVAFFSPQWWHGQARVPWRGWVVRVDPAGAVSPFAAGLRSPCGLGLNSAGDLFVTDNQGDWVPACPIYHVQEGRFYGHPASLAWTPEYRAEERQPSDVQPPETERAPAAVWIPYDWSQSAGNLVPDTTGGRFGPFEGQLFLAELTSGAVLRVVLEKVRGEYQGAVLPFRAGVGSANRVAFAPDGSLICGLTNRGWGGLAPADGLARVRWTGRTPMEMQRIHLVQDGFEITFTQPVAEGLALAPADVHLTQYDYDYWWEYGSPERHLAELEPTAVALSADRRTLTVRAPLQPAMCARLRLSRVVSESGEPLLHPEFSYTINQLPEGPPTRQHVAKAVAPPPARDVRDEGLLRLTYGLSLIHI